MRMIMHIVLIRTLQVDRIKHISVWEKKGVFVKFTCLVFQEKQSYFVSCLSYYLKIKDGKMRKFNCSWTGGTIEAPMACRTVKFLHVEYTIWI